MTERERLARLICDTVAGSYAMPPWESAAEHYKAAHLAAADAILADRQTHPGLMTERQIRAIIEAIHSRVQLYDSEGKGNNRLVLNRIQSALMEELGESTAGGATDPPAADRQPVSVEEFAGRITDALKQANFACWSWKDQPEHERNKLRRAAAALLPHVPTPASPPPAPPGLVLAGDEVAAWDRFAARTIHRIGERFVTSIPVADALIRERRKRQGAGR